MKAKRIVLSSVALAWIPSFLLFGSSWNPIVLALPVMGFCPLPGVSGDPGYSEDKDLIWGIVLLAFFAALGIFAIIRKSNRLAMLFASMLLFSVVLLVLRNLHGIPRP